MVSLDKENASSEYALQGIHSADTHVFRDTSEIRESANWDMIIESALRFVATQRLQVAALKIQETSAHSTRNTDLTGCSAECICR